MRCDNKLRKLFIILLSIVLVLSLAMLAACGNASTDNGDDDDDDDTTSTTTKVVSLPITNGSFANLYDSSDDAAYPRDPKNWTFSVSGSSEATKAPNADTDIQYGVVPADKTVLTGNETTLKNVVGGLSEARQDDVLNLIKKRTLGLNETVAEGYDDNYMLMLRNMTASAVSYASSSFTVPANAHVKVTAWVLTIAEGLDAEANAYIELSSTNGNSLFVKEVNTAGEWQKVEFLVETSEFISRTFNLRLGFGLGDANSPLEHAQGYAFFDDISLTYLTEKAYDNETVLIADASLTGADLDQSQRNLKYTGGDYAAAIDFTVAPTNDIDLNNFSGEYTTYSYSDSSIADQVAPQSEDNFYGIINADNTKYSEFLNPVNFPFSNRDNILVLDNAIATSYHVTLNDTLTVQPNDYYVIGFWVKTSKITNGGLNVYLVDKTAADPADWAYYTKLSNIVAPFDAIDTEKDKTYTDDNWVYYAYLVRGNAKQASELAVEIYFGPDNIKDVPANKLTKGTAFISNFNVTKLSAETYNKSTTSSTSTKITLGSADTVSTTVTNGGFANTLVANPDYTTGAQIPANWTGYPGNHHHLGGTGGLGSSDADFDPMTGTADSTNVISGIVNLDAWASIPGDKIPEMSDANIEAMQKHPGAPNLLMIYNKDKTAYGYKSANMSFAANSFYKVSLDLYTAGVSFGKAHVYLINNDDNTVLTADTTALHQSVSKKSDWQTVSFFVSTGDFTKSYSIVVFLGDMLASSSSDYAQGALFVDDVNVITIGTTVVGASSDSDLLANKNLEALYDAYLADKEALSVVADFRDIDVEVEEEEDDDIVTDDTTTDNNTATGSFDWALFSTLLLAVVLIAVLLILAGRKIIKKHPKKAKASSQYSIAMKQHYGKKAVDDGYVETDTPDEEEDV